jgi:hypothetical protein
VFSHLITDLYMTAQPISNPGGSKKPNHTCSCSVSSYRKPQYHCPKAVHQGTFLGSNLLSLSFLYLLFHSIVLTKSIFHSFIYSPTHQPYPPTPYQPCLAPLAASPPLLHQPTNHNSLTPLPIQLTPGIKN